ncbi:glycine zipper domain-containing protein [Oceaniglobus indicus]|uniref:glycine zipper domain-containing protein n=1 Tax=Oceaniglobus indicus TaxID=2047749 RepID=UPI000C18311A|nr:DUF883 family protein [Oceaniglobus indicus]
MATKDITTEDLAKQVDQLKTDIATLTQSIGDLGRAKGEEVSRSVREQARAARAAGQDHLAAVQLQAEDKYRDAENYVRTNPAAAIGIAAGFGFLVGFLGSRR